jgi:hypothetical protein
MPAARMSAPTRSDPHSGALDASHSLVELPNLRRPVDQQVHGRQTTRGRRAASRRPVRASARSGPPLADQSLVSRHSAIAATTLP